VAYDGREKEWSAVEMLRELDPRLFKACEKFGEDCVKKVAETQKRLLGATKKFVTFVHDNMPDPPAQRPDECIQEWTREGLEQPPPRDLRAPFPALARGRPVPVAAPHAAGGRR
jgi:hypothetical protein